MATVEQIGKYYYVRLQDGSLLKSYTGKTRYFRKHYAATNVADGINRKQQAS